MEPFSAIQVLKVAWWRWEEFRLGAVGRLGKENLVVGSLVSVVLDLIRGEMVGDEMGLDEQNERS